MRGEQSDRNARHREAAPNDARGKIANETMAKEYYPITIRVEDDRHDEWEKHMDEIGVGSYAEYIRMMVATGRNQFVQTSPFERSGGQSLRHKIEDELAADSYTSWDELMEALVESYAEKVERVLDALVEADKVEHSPRKGGWKRYEY